MDNTTNNLRQQELAPGTMLWHDTYRIIKVLGQGGFGITYLAEDLTLNRQVCIKEFFPKEFCGRDDTSHLTVASQSAVELIERMKQKFVKEARNIVALNNPNIVRVHTAFEANNTAYYVMDYIEGESLSEVVKRHGPLAAPTAMRYITQIGEALEYVHRHHINHLDVKPANIMLSRADDRPVLIDFGLAKQYDTEGHQTSTTPVGLSHGFAPLEQYNAGGVSKFSPESDVYSLAATLYYLLTGTVPPNATELASEPLKYPAHFPQQYIPAINRAMATSRKARHESVAQFLRELNSPAAPAASYGAGAPDESTAMSPAAYSTANAKTRISHADPRNAANIANQDTVMVPPPSKPAERWMKPALIIVGAVVVILVLLLIFLPSKKAESVLDDTPVTAVADTTASSQTTAPAAEQAPAPEPAPAPVEKPALPTSGKLVFTGKINGKYAVRVTINTNTSSGSYYYTKYGPGNSMSLRITSFTGSHISMDEYNPQGEYCGSWSGTFSNGKYTGTGNYLGKTMPFYLTQIQ